MPSPKSSDVGAEQGDAVEDLIGSLLSDELKSIASEVAAGRRSHILKTIDERGTAQALIRQQYSGRYPFELLQNSDDAVRPATDGPSQGRVQFLLTESALVVADTGSGFGEDEVRAICGLGRSSKDPRKAIGYKGLGFKSVGEITETPQIFSNQFEFMFDAIRAKEVVSQQAGGLEESQRIPVYAFPFSMFEEDLGGDSDRIRQLRANGFSTIVRLPFKDGVDRTDVERHLRSALSARLLLFLESTQTLEVVGTRHDFVATAVRQDHKTHRRLLLETDGSLEEWIVFSERFSIPDPELKRGLGDEWSVVEEVGVVAAIRIEDDAVVVEGTEPLHVYFPTEEIVGLPIVLSADFALELDRRHVARSPEAEPYNEWLRGRLAGFLSQTVAPELAALFPSSGTMRALAARVKPEGFGKAFLENYISGLAASRFVVVEDGSVHLPGEVRLLPASVPMGDRTRSFLSTDDFKPLVTLEAQADEHVRALLVGDLECLVASLEDTVAALRPPSDGTVEFYAWLVDWSDAAPRGALPQHLSEVPCVRTTEGRSVAPSSGVFFPRERDAPELPPTLTVPIAALPEVDRLRQLMEEAGVRPFRWREIISDRLLPILTEPDVDDADRSAALDALRQYLASEPRGDREIESRIGSILVEAERADGSDCSWRKARSVYFNTDWLGSDALERIYGPFREVEFLVARPPSDSDAAHAEREFFEWIGIASRPRIDERTADRRNVYMWQDRVRHPHRRLAGDCWDSWISSEEIVSAAKCDQGHTASQQLKSSFWLDRLGELIAAGDVRRLDSLFDQLATYWNSGYGGAIGATFHCQHTQHVGERNRTVPSVLGWVLRNAPWVPAQAGDHIRMHRSTEVWRSAPEIPARVLSVLPTLRSDMETADELAFAQSIGVIDAARPRVEDLVDLLKRLAEGFAQEGEIDDKIIRTARWAMRSLDDAVAREGIPNGAVAGVPLLSHFEGRSVFTASPFATDDQLLAETFGDDVAVLAADRGLSRLVGAAGLRRLEDEVSVVPQPREVLTESTRRVAMELSNAAPFLAAVAVGTVPSRAETAIPRLQRLETIVCRQLELAIELDAMVRTRTDAVSYIKTSIRRHGRTQAAFGTAYIEEGADGTVDWFTFGPQLADFLEVPALGDAFALILSAGDTGRWQFLRSRGLDERRVDEAAENLGKPIETLSIPDAREHLAPEGDESRSKDQMADVPDETVGELVDVRPDPIQDESKTDDLPIYPPIDPGSVVAFDAEVDREERSPEQPSWYGSTGSGTTSTEPIDWEKRTRTTREIGRRGEEAVMHYERKRLVSLGYEESAVEWTSNRSETSPFDIRSLDADGQVIFIEVKATIQSNPAEPFEISAAELQFAARKGSRYWIYRVVDAGTASPRIFRFSDPLSLLSSGGASIWMSGAKMSFFVTQGE